MVQTNKFLLNKPKREQVFELCERLGFWNVHPVLVARELDTSHSNICKWKQKWIDKHGVPQVGEYAKQLNVNSLAALKELIKLMKHKNVKIRIKAIDTFFNGQERYIRFLESFGYKEKVLLGSGESNGLPDGTTINKINLYNIVMNIKEEEKKRIIEVEKNESTTDEQPKS